MQKISIFASYQFTNFKHGASQPGGKHGGGHQVEATTPPRGFLHITPIGVFRQEKIIFFLQ